VAKEHLGCMGGSASAKCCTPNIRQVNKRDSDEEEFYEQVVRSYFTDPICTYSTNLLKRTASERKNMSLSK
jgi:hypothetical protein